MNIGCQVFYGACIYGEEEEGKCVLGMCCSKDDFWGTTPKFCSKSEGCQKPYGDYKCGKKDGVDFGLCHDGLCCSRKGYC
eukprot:jgi/Orpsp1_1/1186826/evm.model.d7180000053533.1